MVERTMHGAQTVAEGLSRRRFLGRVGRGAALAAAAMGGVLALGENAHARLAKNRCYVDWDCPPGWYCIYGRCWNPKKKGNKPN